MMSNVLSSEKPDGVFRVGHRSGGRINSEEYGFSSTLFSLYKNAHATIPPA